MLCIPSHPTRVRVKRRWCRQRLLHWEKQSSNIHMQENSIILHSSELCWSTSSQSLSVRNVCKGNTHIEHTNTLPSPKQAHEWQDKWAVFWVLLETVWSLLTWLVNELAEAPYVLCQTAIQPWHLFLNQEGPSLLHPFLFFLSSIYSSSLFHDLVFLLEEQRVSNYLRAIHYRWHPPRCTAEIFRVRKKMGFASTLCSSVLMKRQIEGRRALIFWQSAMLGHEYLLLLSGYLLCKESVKGSWSCLSERREKVWSAALNHLEEASTIQVTWDKLITPQKRIKLTGRITSKPHSTTALRFSLCWCHSGGHTVSQISKHSKRVIFCGDTCGNQTSCLRFWPEIKYTYTISPQWRAIFTSR